MSYLNKVTEMYGMINSGQMMDAFEKYYSPDVVMIEATGDVRKGKDLNREFEMQFLGSVKDWHDGGVTCITGNEESGYTAVESWMEVTFMDGNKVKMEQIARQKWEGDQIVEERFYYNPAGMTEPK